MKKIIVFDDSDATQTYTKEYLQSIFKNEIENGEIQLVDKSKIFIVNEFCAPKIDVKEELTPDQIKLIEKNQNKEKPWKKKNYRKKFKL